MPGGLDDELPVSLRRVIPFVLLLGLFVVESPEEPGGKGSSMLGWAGVVGEGSNPDLEGV